MKHNELLRHEVIGLNVEVIRSMNKGLVGMKGKVIDETRNIITLESNGCSKRLIKSQVILKVSYRGRDYEVDGKIMVNRPEDRIKRIRGLR
ncbi:ribonuclease P protein subunit [Candidatus Woesearchaeota archaeon]|nr:ribonuclease P protein subunit [Candidatus Woesearchaeota archaeon]